MGKQTENHKKMSGFLIESVQSNWCQTNLVSFNSMTIDFVSHLHSSKAFHSISSHFFVYMLRKHCLDESLRVDTELLEKLLRVVSKIHAQNRRYNKPEPYGGLPYVCYQSLWMANEFVFLLYLQVIPSWERGENVNLKKILKVGVWNKQNQVSIR